MTIITFLDVLVDTSKLSQRDTLKAAISGINSWSQENKQLCDNGIKKPGVYFSSVLWIQGDAIDLQLILKSSTHK